MLALDAAGYPLSTNDRILGAIGLALIAGQAQNASYDLTGANMTNARLLIAPLVASDSFASSLDSYLGSR
jgi:hypothetical protein